MSDHDLTEPSRFKSWAGHYHYALMLAAFIVLVAAVTILSMPAWASNLLIIGPAIGLSLVLGRVARYHDGRFCGTCFNNGLRYTNNDGNQRSRSLLAAHHIMRHSSYWLGAFTGMLLVIVLVPQSLSMLVWAVYLVGEYTLLQRHRTFAPWCPHCHNHGGGGGDDPDPEPEPEPDPDMEKERDRTRS